MTTITLPEARTATAAPSTSLRSLAWLEAKRYAKHPLFLVGLVLAIITSLVKSGPDELDYHVIPSFFIGVLGIIVAGRLASATRRSEPVIGATPVSELHPDGGTVPRLRCARGRRCLPRRAAPHLHRRQAVSELRLRQLQHPRSLPHHDGRASDRLRRCATARYRGRALAEIPRREPARRCRRRALECGVGIHRARWRRADIGLEANRAHADALHRVRSDKRQLE